MSVLCGLLIQVEQSEAAGWNMSGYALKGHHSLAILVELLNRERTQTGGLMKGHHQRLTKDNREQCASKEQVRM